MFKFLFKEFGPTDRQTNQELRVKVHREVMLPIFKQKAKCLMNNM